MLLRSIAILQPVFPHYRNEFFCLLKNRLHRIHFFSYEKSSCSYNEGYKIDFLFSHIKRIILQNVLWYTPLPLIRNMYDGIVLPLNIGHVTTWLLLMTKFIHKKKIILWGQGISVKRYLKEEIKPDWKLKCMISMSDGVWLYMEKERKQWKSIFPNKPIVALGNSLSDVDKMMSYKPLKSVADLRNKYGVKESTIFIFCARFCDKLRRVDLLVKIIESLNPEKNGYIIIGDGIYKPDFQKYSNVYDFGALYDNNIKAELFSLSDLYLQPAYCGLSIVEALAYGKPVCTFKRSKYIKQGVELSYVKDGYNGLLFENMDDCINKLKSLSQGRIMEISYHARTSVFSCSPEQMVENAISIL